MNRIGQMIGLWICLGLFALALGAAGRKSRNKIFKFDGMIGGKLAPPQEKTAHLKVEP